MQALLLAPRLGTWLTLGLIALSAGCSVKRVAINRLGDALATAGTTFASDDDPELVKAAAPFSLKLMESLLAESPDHTRLLSATASSFAPMPLSRLTLTNSKRTTSQRPKNCGRGLGACTCGLGIMACARWRLVTKGLNKSCEPLLAARSFSPPRKTCRCSIGPRYRGPGPFRFRKTART